MVAILILGVIIWWLTIWISKRKGNIPIDVSQRLPKDFKNSNLTDSQKRQTYQEARKKYLEKNAKPIIDLPDEALIKHQVFQKHGHINVPPNEGAFALSEARMERTKARRKVRQEFAERIEAFGKANKQEQEQKREQKQEQKQESTNK